MKIAIITMHAARNYGAVLQTYALQEYLEDKGAEVEIIDYKRKDQVLAAYLFNVNAKFKNSKLKSFLFIIKSFIPKLYTSRLFLSFLKRKIHLSFPVHSSDAIQDIVKADIYCTGSDQVWNPIANSGFDSMYFLKGVSPKVSYASSIGVYSLEPKYQTTIKIFLDSYKSISIREESSLTILNDLNIKGECVLDPSFLLTDKEWNAFAKAYKKIPERYLLIYYFGNASTILKTARKIADNKELRIVRISVNFDKYREDDVVIRFPTPEEFVFLFSQASFIVTNSFHGTAFSINYGIDFLVNPTTEHNARFDSILNMFHLQTRNIRLLEDPILTSQEAIDWNKVHQILDEKRQSSYMYIDTNILKLS